MSLKDHRRSGRFGNAGKALPKGNARRGLALFRTGRNRIFDQQVTPVAAFFQTIFSR